MSTTPFLRDPVFWFVLLLLNAFWFLGLRLAHKNGWATPWQMYIGGRFGICWFGHSGFLSLLFFVQPVLAWATSRMWPLWSQRTGLVVIMLFLGLVIGYVLQSWWSSLAGSSDAWSENGKPNNVGIVHIVHMSPEIGIMLLLLASGAWFREMPWAMFFGILLIIANHFLLGMTHWPLRVWFPFWRPQDWTTPLSARETIQYASASIGMLAFGIGLILRS